MELYVERGFEQTTVAEIAERAGLTARTFFRHFADKREVLFAGLGDAAGAAGRAPSPARPADASPMEAVGAALDAAGRAARAAPRVARQRQAVIAANAELQERELIKMASLAAALADGLRRRGVAEPERAWPPRPGVAVFRVAFERWVAGPPNRRLTTTIPPSFNRVRRSRPPGDDTMNFSTARADAPGVVVRADPPRRHALARTGGPRSGEDRPAVPLGRDPAAALHRAGVCGARSRADRRRSSSSTGAAPGTSAGTRSRGTSSTSCNRGRGRGIGSTAIGVFLRDHRAGDRKRRFMIKHGNDRSLRDCCGRLRTDRLAGRSHYWIADGPTAMSVWVRSTSTA